MSGDMIHYGVMVRVFANGSVAQGSSRVLPQLDASLLKTQHYKVQLKSKWSNPGKSVAPSTTSWFTRY